MQAAHYMQDFYGDDFICAPFPRCADMRAAGPVVWLPGKGCFAVLRHVSRWESDGEPVIAMNNTIGAFAHLQVRIA